MTAYPLDPEFAAALAMMPAADVSDLIGARDEIHGVLAAMNADVDTDGVDVDEIRVPGPEGAPMCTCSATARRGSPDRFPWSTTSTAAASSWAPRISTTATMCWSAGSCKRWSSASTTGWPRSSPTRPVSRTATPACPGSPRTPPSWALALLARDRGGPAIRFQYLGVSELDDRLDTPSMRAFTDTPSWNRPNAVISWDSYRGPGIPGTDGSPPLRRPRPSRRHRPRRAAARVHLRHGIRPPPRRRHRLRPRPPRRRRQRRAPPRPRHVPAPRLALARLRRVRLLLSVGWVRGLRGWGPGPTYLRA